ncbi:crotonase/enoyl-CoA hydratase family protein [Tsuneonella mangrovi]|uniref:crotonase/enoyl-CoA hydratase family protein n=1 Tax=Tsuneonella mangrovi TaxID=1982042 RepID=UPI000BA1DFB0|nr:crotonase/enoyl-CoA hydratase family protein [Tsuneonella mangrovi]
MDSYEDRVGRVDSAFPLTGNQGEYLADPSSECAVPEGLLRLKELECLYQAESETLWTYMAPVGRPSFTSPMLGDFENWQKYISQDFGPGKVPLKFLVLGSRSPGVFCFGGDLALFQRLIRDEDRDGLVRYGHRCCAILHRNLHALEIPMLTIGLVEGAALGGGFEALLSFDYIIADRDATFGLPEVLFGLFPGMGAHALLSRKLGTAMAERIIQSNETYSAQQMYELGIVHHLAEPGEGLAAAQEFIKRSTRRHAGLVAERKAMRMASPLALDELNRITELWADAALQLREQDLKVMNRLAAAQTRLAQAA